ncbi:alpha/beta hydrolase [Fontimonas sp. SYSU GA230001]|uniref:alpha/beta hydrolase n=1 Tax=Fontimonas sp. SYSU GA230001 TaxID=3142450 RepID=UPI0032B4C21C
MKRRNPMISHWLAPLALLFLVLSGCSSPQVVNRFAADTGYKGAVNLPYDRKLGLDLDVYYPPQASAAPVIVFFYGGRWTLRDKSEFEFVGQALASRGFVTLIPNVRKYPDVRFPEFVNDAARALRWARDNAATYGGDPDKLFVMGHSSGAHIAALLALNEEYLKKVGGSRAWLRGMIGLAGAYDFMPITAPDLRDLFGPVDRFQYSQPIFYVDGRNPPLLLIHGRNDEVLSVSNTENLARSVAKAGGPVETVIYDSLSHNMVIGALASYLRGRADVLDNIEEFVVRISKQPRSARRQLDLRATPLQQDDVDGVEAQPLPTPEPVPDSEPVTPMLLTPVPASSP